jgi:hypothetical protein
MTFVPWSRWLLRRWNGFSPGRSSDWVANIQMEPTSLARSRVPAGAAHLDRYADRDQNAVMPIDKAASASHRGDGRMLR